MELPPEIWCEIVRYLELEKLEEQVSDDRFAVKDREQQVEKITESLHYIVWRLRQVMNRISDIQYELETSLACFHRVEPLSEIFTASVKKVEKAVDLMGSIQIDYGGAVREMSEVINQMSQ